MKKNIFENPKNAKIAKNLLDNGKYDELMEFFYAMVQRAPRDCIMAHTPNPRNRINSIKNALDYFIEKEEYERCILLNELYTELLAMENKNITDIK